MNKITPLFFILILALAACTATNTPTPTPAAANTVVPPTGTPINTATPSPSPTPTPTDSFSKEELEPDLEKTLGEGVISGVSVSPDGKLAVHVKDGHLQLLDPQTLEELFNFSLDQNSLDNYYETFEADFSPKGNYIVLKSDFGSMQFYKINGASLKKIYIQPVSERPYRPVFSPDEQSIACIGRSVTSSGAYESIYTADLKNDAEAFRLPLVNDHLSNYHIFVTPPIFSPNSKYVATGTNEKLVYLWDRKTHEIFHTLQHASRITSIDFSPNSRQLASGSLEGLVRLWDVNSGTLIRTISGFQNDIYEVHYAKDGRSLEIEDFDHQCYFWDALTNQLSTVPCQPEEVSASLQLEEMYYQQGYIDSDTNNLVRYSPSGNLAAISTKNVTVWDISSDTMLGYYKSPSKSTIRGMTFSPDENHLAALTTSGEILLWDIITGDLQTTNVRYIFPFQQVFAQMGGSAISYGTGTGLYTEQGLTFSPDGESLIFANGSTIEIWDVSTWQKAQTLTISQEFSAATDFSFSPDGDILYTVLNRNQNVLAWDFASGELLKTITLPDVSNYAASAISLRGQYYARNNSKDNSTWIEIWNLADETMTKVAIANGFNEPLALSPDGQYLITVDEYENLEFWDSETGKLILSTPMLISTESIDIHPEGNQFIMTKTGKLNVYTIENIQLAALVSMSETSESESQGIETEPTPTPLPLADLPPANPVVLPENAITVKNAVDIEPFGAFSKGLISNVTWSQNSDQIIVSSATGVYRYAVAGLEEKATFDLNAFVYLTTVTEEGKLLAVTKRGDHIDLWDVTEKSILYSYTGTGSPAISHNGTMIAYKSEAEGEYKIYNPSTGEYINTLKSYAYYSYLPIFSPNDTYIATIQSDDSARIWRTDTGEIVNSLPIYNGTLESISFSQDGRYLLGAAGSDVLLLDIESGKLPERFTIFPERPEDPDPGIDITPDNNPSIDVTAAALSPDQQFIAAGTGLKYTFLIDRFTGKTIAKLEGDTNIITHLSFSPNGKRLLSIDADGTMVIWEIPSGKRLANIQTHSGPIEGLVFREDGNLAAWEENTTWVISPQNGESLYTTRIPTGTIYAVSPDGENIAVYQPIHMELWNLEGIKQTELPGDAEWMLLRIEIVENFFDAQFSTNGSTLFTIGSKGVYIHDIVSGTLITQIGSMDYEKIAVSPTNELIATCSYYFYQCDPSISNLPDSTGISLYPNLDWEYDETIVDFQFSTDEMLLGAAVAAVGKPGSLMLFNTGSAELLYKIPFPDESLYSLAFGPDRKLAAVGTEEGAIHLLNIETGETLFTLQAHNGAVTHLLFSADGTVLASASDDGTVKTWGVP